MSKILIVLFVLLSFSAHDCFAEIGGNSSPTIRKNNSKIDVVLKPKRIKPLDNSERLTSYYMLDSERLVVCFNYSEGWADLVVSTPMGDVVHKERFHTGFEFSTYIGVPDMPWKIEVTTTQGGEYEGWLIIQE